jgi:hypothetical protein
MSGEKLSYWSGPAAAIGGILWLLPWSGLLGEISDTGRLILNLPGLLLVAVGVAGLYLQIRASGNRGSTPAFGLALIGILLVISPVVVALVTGPTESGAPPVLAIAGAVFLVVGLVVMGVISISHKSLGGLSFVPLALAGDYIGFLASIGLSANNQSIEFLVGIFGGLTIFCWLLLGAALWIRRGQTAGTALQL